MLRISILACAVLLIGCGKGDSQQAPAENATKQANPLSVYAGEWSVQAFSQFGQALVDVGVVATDSKEGWAMVFDHLDEPVPAHHVTVQTDSVAFTVGPYPSALRDSVMVTTTSILHAEGDRISGRFTAVYTDSDPPILQGRLEGVRAQ